MLTNISPDVSFATGSQPATIYAPCTPPGKSGVAVLRVSGPGAGPACQALAGMIPAPRRMVHRSLHDPRTGEGIDDALVVFFPGPHSFTGLDVVEFHLHGSRAVMSALVEALGGIPGLSLAEPGAFARQAFDHGKLDLTCLEGLADLIDSETAGQRRQALQIMGGHNARVFARLREDMVSSMALLESALDFADEPDVPDHAMENAAQKAEQLAGVIQAWLDAGDFSEKMREGFVVAIAGAPNVGKSSLINVIARREVAIVSDLPGTTRDAIEVQIDLGGLSVRFIDTAGIRESDDPIEHIGIARTHEAVRKADLVIQMEDPESLPIPPETLSVDSLRVVNKVDLLPERPESLPGEKRFYISTKEYNGIHELLEYIQNTLESHEQTRDAPIVARARHRQELANCRDHLRQVSRVELPELAAEELRLAAQAIGRLTGVVTPEEILGSIFSRFCIGK
ncbi:MAG: tRNA uridine-5-carboxymethylaminomethyl(34) synthesis GTPase MnmE [Alphaproteobacteria bacterium GWF2_58_20]|nr:MAG: tRNA uridine-5-carboxymethylaminomethyl(34) synthesis GTPase MnmE [Alphaproteobacteria bacterium GWF2_58_20]